jgi:hypothetical protein
MTTYTIANRTAAKRALANEVSEAVAVMWEGQFDLTERLQTELASAVKQRLTMAAEHGWLSDLNIFISEADFARTVTSLKDDDRKIAWTYRRIALRRILLHTILTNKKKVAWLVRATLEKLLLAVAHGNQSLVTVSQLVHNMPLNADTFTVSETDVRPITAWGVDELRLQLLSEMAEADLITILVSKHTHMVQIPKEVVVKVPSERYVVMDKLALLVDRKTVLVEPAPIESKEMISQSSWWYKTPELSVDQREFIATMHSLKWEFVDGAEDMLEGALKEHHKADRLPEWVVNRMPEYLEQIAASRANGGHYCAGQFDSVLRWYWQSEIGHNQTSPALRKLVKPVGVANAVKYDATNNVVQMYAIGLKSKGLAKYVNLVDIQERETDVRLQLAVRLNEAFGLDVFNKDNIKPLFMVWAYNAGKERLLSGVTTIEKNFFTGEEVEHVKTEGLRALTGGVIADDQLWAVWQSVTAELVPDIVDLKVVMNQLIKQNSLIETSWKMPDGAIAQYVSVEQHGKVLHWVDSNFHSRQHTHHRKQLTIDAKAAGLLPRMIHSMDAYFMRTLVLRAKAQGIVIVPNHDSFMFDVKYTDIVMAMAKSVFVDMMNMGVLNSIVNQYNRTNSRVSKAFGDRELLTVEDIMAGDPLALED